MNKVLSLNKKHTLLWSFYHGAIFIAFLISLFFTKKINFSSDFSSMIPSSSSNKIQKIAENAVNSTSGNSVFILVSHKNFDVAKKNAQAIYEKLNDSSRLFDSISLYTDEQDLKEVSDFISSWRFNLLDDETNELLSVQEGREEFAFNALASVYGGFNVVSLENIVDDPFLLDELNYSNFINAIGEAGTALSPKDGVLATEYESKWFVMIRLSLSDVGAALNSKDSAVPFIYKVCDEFENDELKCVFYGTPFHSYEASKNASFEISLISTISLVCVVLILYFVFRSSLPLFASMFSIVLSVATAFCATHLIFGNIHASSLVFGTSLIGSCIDYSLHYFVNWKTVGGEDTTSTIRVKIFNGLILSLVSTEICFALLFFAPFEMLKQMAVFSFFGILSSFLTVNGLFTLFKLPKEEKRGINISLKIFIPKIKFVPFILFIVCTVILILNYDKLKIHNNIKNLYQMQGRLKNDTELAYKVIDYSPTNWLIVSGQTQEEVLQKEEKIVFQLGSSDKIVCTTKFIPSASKQKKSLENVKKLIPLAAAQYESLGFGLDEQIVSNFKNNVMSAQNKILTLDENVPKSLKSLLNILWIGEHDGKFYSLILPNKINDLSVYERLASEDENVFFENKIEDISFALDKLTSMIALFFAISFVLIAIVMLFFYKLSDALKILSIPLLCVMVILSVFVLCGLDIEFFCITGMVLVFGLGLDYVIYSVENKNDKFEQFAIFLSFLTTAISFGALAFSSFVPVHVIGLAIFSGLVTAFVCKN